ncbi:MAG TPA: class I SAM-dependent methyltransferase [Motilibacteraceae bacterium]|nr:class I SAM-dependent methyltransferase [Motilibacteraceae bacterium]
MASPQRPERATAPAGWDTGDWRRRGASFGGGAAAYHAARPAYPDARVDWMLAPAGKASLEVADVGAGTGVLSRPLAARGHRVVALDPAPAMLAHAGVPAAVARAERLPLRDHAVDAVTVGQAFHWFDAPRALAEFRRVLRPGGVLSMCWNRTDMAVAPWVSALALPASGREGVTITPVPAITASGLFGPVEEHEERFVQRLDVASLLTLVSSQSAYLVGSEESRSAMLEAARSVHAAHADVDGVLELPWVATGFRTRVA